MRIARVSFGQAVYLALVGLLLASVVLFTGMLLGHAEISAVSISSNNPYPSVAKVGDTVTLTFATPAGMMPTVTVDGHPAMLTGGPTAWTAQYVMQPTDPAGAVVFAITDAAGTVTSTTNGTYVTLFTAAPRANLFAIDGLPGAHSAKSPFRVMAVFNEPVSNIGKASFITQNATVTDVLQNPDRQVYLLTIVPAVAGPWSVTLPSNQGADIAGNTTSGMSSLAFVYDPTATGSVGTSGVGIGPVNGGPAPATPSTSATAPTSGTSAAMNASAAGSMAPAHTTISSASAAAAAVLSKAVSGSKNLIGTSSIMIGTSTDASSTATSTASTTASTSTAVWLGIIVILILLVGGGWWYSRNVTPTV